MSKKTTILHISDLHFANSQSLLRGMLGHGNLFSKRHIGWLNFKLNRRRKFDPSYKLKLLEKLKSLQWDYLVISGDLTTLSLESEFKKARQHLSPLIEMGPVLITAGNHDRYVRNSATKDLMIEYFGDCWPFNTQQNSPSREIIRELGEQAVIVELDMAIPRPVFSSRGKLRQNLSFLRSQLKNVDKKKVKIAIGHYPAFLPENETEGYWHRLSKRSVLQQFLLQEGFEFYLHGHIHKSWCFKPDPTHALTCVNSGGSCCNVQENRGGFHRIIIEDYKSRIDHLFP